MFVSLWSRHGASSGFGWRAAANILNKQPQTVDKWWSSNLVVGWAGGGGANCSHRKSPACYKMLHWGSDLDGFLGTTWAAENEYEIKI
jgi:hypothetical protein